MKELFKVELVREVWMRLQLKCSRGGLNLEWPFETSEK